MATYIIIMWYVSFNSSSHPTKSEIIGIAQSLKEAECHIRNYIKSKSDEMESFNYRMYEFDIEKWEFGEDEFSDIWIYDGDGVRK